MKNKEEIVSELIRRAPIDLIRKILKDQIDEIDEPELRKFFESWINRADKPNLPTQTVVIKKPASTNIVRSKHNIVGMKDFIVRNLDKIQMNLVPTLNGDEWFTIDQLSMVLLKNNILPVLQNSNDTTNKYKSFKQTVYRSIKLLSPQYFISRQHPTKNNTLQYKFAQKYSFNKLSLEEKDVFNGILK
jgi:hypothetical protein